MFIQAPEQWEFSGKLPNSMVSDFLSWFEEQKVPPALYHWEIVRANYPANPPFTYLSGTFAGIDQTQVQMKVKIYSKDLAVRFKLAWTGLDFSDLFDI